MALGLAILAGLITGIKHGLDWDHIAAISDITSTQKAGAGIRMSFLYGVGHASVVASIALGFLFMGFALPKGVDALMGTIVGITLIILGGYVFYTLHKGKEFRPTPRWALAANLALNTYGWVKAKLKNAPRKEYQVLKDGYGKRAPYLIGMIHGIGAETPTQMLLFALAISAGVSGTKELGAAIIIVYSIGLVTTNTLMGAFGAYGYARSGNGLYRAAAFATGAFSILLGIILVVGGAGLLPKL